MPRPVALLLATAALLAGAHPAGAAITPADVEPDVRALQDIAAANGGNRAAGLPGYDRSADFVAGRLHAAGWQVTRKQVRFPFFEERSAPSLDGPRPNRDFVTLRFSGSGEVAGKARLIFADRCNRRSFRDIRRGDVAVVFAACTYRRAALTAQRQGAVAILFEGGPDEYPLRGTLERPDVAIPALAVRTGVLFRLVRRRTIRIRVDGVSSERTADNVVAEIPGGERVVMAGGHLDSVPEGPGLNDNGSGVALLLALADRLPSAPRRATFRLAFWTGEEYGLYGSDQYVAGLPAAERRRIAAYLNFDMVGSPNAVPEIYDGPRRIERMFERELPRARTVDLTGVSDHAAFEKAGIPTGGLYTGGLEPARRGRALRDRCYHRRCDAADNVDLGTLARMATVAERVVLRLSRG